MSQKLAEVRQNLDVIVKRSEDEKAGQLIAISATGKEEQSLFEQAFIKISEQINQKEELKKDEDVLKLSNYLKENYNLVETLKIDLSEAENLANIVNEGNQIINELQEKISKKNRNISALLKSSFDKIKNYYSQFLTKLNQLPIDTVKEPDEINKSYKSHPNPSPFFNKPAPSAPKGGQSMVGFIAKKDVKATQEGIEGTTQQMAYFYSAEESIDTRQEQKPKGFTQE